MVGDTASMQAVDNIFASFIWYPSDLQFVQISTDDYNNNTNNNEDGNHKMHREAYG